MSYATPDDLFALGLPEPATEELTTEDVQAQLDADAGIMDVYLASQYTLPLVAPYPDALIRINVCLATYHILCRRGFNPEGPDAMYQENFTMCMDMLEKVSDGRLTIPGIEDGTPNESDGAPQVATFVTRDWQTTWSDKFA